MSMRAHPFFGVSQMLRPIWAGKNPLQAFAIVEALLKQLQLVRRQQDCLAGPIFGIWKYSK